MGWWCIGSPHGDARSSRARRRRRDASQGQDPVGREPLPNAIGNEARARAVLGEEPFQA